MFKESVQTVFNMLFVSDGENQSIEINRLGKIIVHRKNKGTIEFTDTTKLLEYLESDIE